MAVAHASKGDVRAAKAEAKEMDAALKELKAKTKDTPKALVAARMELGGQISDGVCGGNRRMNPRLAPT